MSQEKILTISVAAYNVESYIAENLDSILITDVRDEIEVLVVDDGGNDGTLEIARKYEEQYPGIIRAVHKENGGYGSVQNYTMQNASGRFFKILDGDDVPSCPSAWPRSTRRRMRSSRITSRVRTKIP